jgi:ribosomal protein S18 acetylase RimI-like enzyme
MFSPNGLFLVACEASDPAAPVGYVHCARLGDDAGAKEFVASKGRLMRLWMYIMKWIFWAYDKVDLWIRPGGAIDREALNLLREWGREDELIHWKSRPERSSRWYVNGLVIDPEYQGRGIGKMLMAEPMKRAQSERVIIGLTASPHGEFLYRKLGFQMLADFCKRPHIERPDEKGGGIMIWYPEGYEGVQQGD